MNQNINDKIFAEVNIAGRQTTGKTRHTVDGVSISSESILRIVQLDGDDSFYLIHYGEDEIELTDTCHQSIQEALEQAEFEYGLKSDDWKFFDH